MFIFYSSQSCQRHTRKLFTMIVFPSIQRSFKIFPKIYHLERHLVMQNHTNSMKNMWIVTKLLTCRPSAPSFVYHNIEYPLNQFLILESSQVFQSSFNTFVPDLPPLVSPSLWFQLCLLSTRAKMKNKYHSIIIFILFGFSFLQIFHDDDIRCLFAINNILLHFSASFSILLYQRIVIFKNK